CVVDVNSFERRLQGDESDGASNQQHHHHDHHLDQREAVNCAFHHTACLCFLHVFTILPKAWEVALIPVWIRISTAFAIQFDLGAACCISQWGGAAGIPACML